MRRADSRINIWILWSSYVFVSQHLNFTHQENTITIFSAVFWIGSQPRRVWKWWVEEGSPNSEQMAAADPKKKFRWTNLLVITWDCLKIVYPKANGSWSLSLLNGYHWGYTLFSDKPTLSSILRLLKTPVITSVKRRTPAMCISSDNLSTWKKNTNKCTFFYGVWVLRTKKKPDSWHKMTFKKSTNTIPWHIDFLRFTTGKGSDARASQN